MKQKSAFIFSLIAAAVIIFSCSKDDDNSGNPHTNPIVGTWKLVGQYDNDVQVDLSDCDLMETYIFGAEQFSNTLYGSNASGFDFGNTQFRGDDEDGDEDEDQDEGEDENGDENADESGDESGDSGETGDDDPGNVPAACAVSDTFVGNWQNPSGADYIFTVNNVNSAKQIYFTDNLNRFYFEETVVVNGVSVVRKKVCQRQ